MGYRSGRLLGKHCRGSQSRSILGFCNFTGAVEQRSISLWFAEPQVSLSVKEVFQIVGRRNSDHVRSLERGRVDSGALEELSYPHGLMVAARSSDAEMGLPMVLWVGDAKSLYDHLRTETSGGANDRCTGIDKQIIRSSMGTRCNGEVGGPQWHVR